MYPDYRVSQMLKKGKLGKMTKRLMTMYRSYDFRQRLEYQCKKHNRELVIVDESYTSCTCGKCGKKTQTDAKNKKTENT
jgi:putative transposase